MAEYFRDAGRTLLSNGYLIIPIKPGYKRPALDNWQSSRLGAGDLQRYPGHGVGVLCGQGARPVVGVDVDTSDETLAAQFVAWCQENLGATCERVGNAPKILLVYRASEADWGKSTGAWFARDWQAAPNGHYFSGGAQTDTAGRLTHKDPVHRLEILGQGQQFVAYHVHPDTHRPYEWVDIYGGIDAVRAEDLPVVTQAQINEALQVFEAMAIEAGLARKPNSTTQSGSRAPAVDDDPLMAYEPPAGIDLDEARQLLTFIDAQDYDVWLRVGMSLHHEFSGDADALTLWDTWSSEAANYAGRDDLEHRWDSFGRSGRAPTTARWLIKIGRENKRIVARAEKRGALDEAKGQIAACEDSILLINEVARNVGDLADDLALRAELAGLIRQRFKDLTGTLLPVADVRTAMAAGGRKAPTISKSKRQMTEFGNAERMLDQYGIGLSFVPELGAWQAWTGVYWKRASSVDIEHLAKETVRGLADESKTIENDDERVAFFKFCAISQRAIMVRNMVSLASSDPRVVVPVGELDKDNWLLGVGNGAVDLRTGKLLAPDRDHWITTVTPVEYDQAARAPLFEQTVRDVFHDDTDMVAFFQRVIGYSILGQPKEDVLIIPYGSGSNGKSTVLGAIRDALGDHAKSASANTFLATGGAGGSNAGSPREDILRLRGARFVYVSEPDEGSELREGLIKSMTGGDPMPARGLHSKVTVEVMPTWAAFMPTNHKPIVKGDDHAIWRRLLPIPFTRNFDKDLTVEKDPQRAEKLKAEAAGILAWCVQGALAYQREGLNPPGVVRAAHNDYKQDMDLLAEWLDTCCETGQGLVASNSDLWVSWEHFARTRGELRFIPSSKSLGRRLESRGFTKIQHTYGLKGRGFVGLSVTNEGMFE